MPLSLYVTSVCVLYSFVFLYFTSIVITELYMYVWYVFIKYQSMNQSIGIQDRQYKQNTPAIDCTMTQLTALYNSVLTDWLMYWRAVFQCVRRRSTSSPGPLLGGASTLSPDHQTQVREAVPGHRTVWWALVHRTVGPGTPLPQTELDSPHSRPYRPLYIHTYIRVICIAHINSKESLCASVAKQVSFQRLNAKNSTDNQLSDTYLFTVSNSVLLLSCGRLVSPVAP